MQTNNINIIGIFDSNGNIAENKTIIIDSKESTSTIKVRFSMHVKNINNVQSIKVESFFFGDVINTTNVIYARQGEIIIVDSIFQLKYPSNPSVTKNEVDLDYLIEGYGIYFSTLNDESWRIKIIQPSSVQIELAQYGTYVPDLTRYLEQDGLVGGKVLLGTIRAFYINEAWLEAEVTTQGKTFSFNSIVEKEDKGNNLVEFKFYLTDYSPNYSNDIIGVKFTICGTSTTTGKKKTYSDGNLTFRQTASNMNEDLHFNPNKIVTNYKGDIISCTLQYTNGTTTLGTIETPSWANYRTISTSTKDNIVTQVVEITIGKNTLLTDRTGTLTINSTIGGNSKVNKYDVIQYTEPNRTNVGVWSDIYCNFTADTITQFSLCDDETDTILYNGYTYPINNVCNINLKDIINNYISQDIQFLFKDNNEIEIQKPFGKYFSNPNSSKTFYVKVNNEIIQTYHVVYNYSFEQDYIDKINNKVYLQMPIQGIIDYRQYGFLSRYHFNEIKDMRDEDTLVVEIPYIIPTLSFVQPLVTRTNKINNISFKIPRPTNVGYRKYINRCNIKVNSQIDYTFKIHQNNCHKYCLYYVNKYGGIDWFLFSNYSKESRQLTYEKAKFGDNNKYYTRNVNQSWTLRTEYLTDKQSKLMPNLLESTCLYLHDLETDELYPVNITDTKYDLKTRHTNGRKMYNYVINVESQQERKIIG